MWKRAQVFSAIVLLALASTVLAQSPRETAIREVIARQLDAMKRGDEMAAFAFASPAIQSTFGDAANFMRMVERGYPQVYRSRRHDFLKLDTFNDRLIQRVLIESDAGTVVARYAMVEIDGVSTAAASNKRKVRERPARGETGCSFVSRCKEWGSSKNPNNDGGF